MTYQYITIEGVKLAYQESTSDSDKIIFLIHGNSTSSKVFEKHINSHQLSTYHLIAIDLPAHGESDSLSGSRFTYSLPQLGEILSLAVKQLAQEKKYLLAGVSLGTNIIAEMLNYNIRPAGIALIGSSIIGREFTMEKVFKKDIDLHAGFVDAVPENDLKDYSELVFSSKKEKDRLDFANDYNRVKDNFRSNMFGTVVAGNLSDELSLLTEQSAPILAVFGEEEKVCETNYLDNAGLNLWKGRSFKIKNAGHFVNIDQPDKLSELLADYAMHIFI